MLRCFDFEWKLLSSFCQFLVKMNPRASLLYMQMYLYYWLFFRKAHRRKIYSRSIFLNRRKLGSYSTLVKELQTDAYAHYRYFRLSRDQFTELLDIISAELSHAPTHFIRESIQKPLRFLKKVGPRPTSIFELFFTQKPLQR